MSSFFPRIYAGKECLLLRLVPNNPLSHNWSLSSTQFLDKKLFLSETLQKILLPVLLNSGTVLLWGSTRNTASGLFGACGLSVITSSCGKGQSFFLPLDSRTICCLDCKLKIHLFQDIQHFLENVALYSINNYFYGV